MVISSIRGSLGLLRCPSVLVAPGDFFSISNGLQLTRLVRVLALKIRQSQMYLE